MAFPVNQRFFHIPVMPNCLSEGLTLWTRWSVVGGVCLALGGSCQSKDIGTESNPCGNEISVQ